MDKFATSSLFSDSMFVSVSSTCFLSSIQSLLSPDVNYSLVLRLCFRSHDVQGAYKELTGGFVKNPRKLVRGLFDYALENPASDEAMRRVISAAVQAERDLINGVDDTIAVHEFVRTLCG